MAPADDEAMDAQNRRDNERLPFAAEVLVARPDRGWRTAVLDLSEGGCALLRPAGFDLHIGAVVTLYFLTRNGPGPGVGARVARLGPRDIGFEYHDVQAVPPSLGTSSPSAVGR
ncbi:hypothetical protein GCM10028794_17500 [Silanimonas algicola]